MAYILFRLLFSAYLIGMLCLLGISITVVIGSRSNSKLSTFAKKVVLLPIWPLTIFHKSGLDIFIKEKI